MKDMMTTEKLANGVRLALRPFKNRQTVSVTCDVTKNGERFDVKFWTSVIPFGEPLNATEMSVWNNAQTYMMTAADVEKTKMTKKAVRKSASKPVKKKKKAA